MDTMTISQVSKTYQVTTRTLRYYEQIGLLGSIKQEDYAYRTYDEQALIKLQQIIILRKLRIPLKGISTILKNQEAVSAIELFTESLQEVEQELASLSVIQTTLSALIEHIRRNMAINIPMDLLDNEDLVKIADNLQVAKRKIKEDKVMNEVKQNDGNQNEVDLNEDVFNATIALKDVRIVFLPPATVASCHYIGEEPESYVNSRIDEFVRKNHLAELKPDMRHYGFNHPDPVDETGYHGYEMWVTIPDDMEVPEPLVKKQFNGGLYAAHMIPFGAFEEWRLLYEWVEKSKEYEFNTKEEDKECSWGCLEEHLNYVNHVNLLNTEPEGLQLDLLIPVKPVV